MIVVIVDCKFIQQKRGIEFRSPQFPHDGIVCTCTTQLYRYVFMYDVRVYSSVVVLFTSPNYNFSILAVPIF